MGIVTKQKTKNKKNHETIAIKQTATTYMKNKWMISMGPQQKICARIRQNGRIGLRKDKVHIKERGKED